MIKIGIIQNSYGELALEEEIRLMRKNGFTATFLYCEYENFDRDVAAFREGGIDVETIHAPFQGINHMWIEGDEGDKMLNRLLYCVDAANRNNIPVVVVHLSSGEHPPKINETGNRRFDQLIEYARSKGVTLAFENQRKLGNLAHIFEYYDDIGFCWDVGHEACFADGREYMPLFGKRLCALHLHDNRTKKNSDDHMIPYDGKIDLDKAARFIANAPFDGTIMLEVDRRRSSIYDNYTPEKFFQKAGEAAKKFAAAVEKYRDI